MVQVLGPCNTKIEDLSGVLGSRLWSGPTQAIVGIWGMKLTPFA